MLRAGLSCDPKSVLAGALVENHLATLYNVCPASRGSLASDSSVPSASSSSTDAASSLSAIETGSTLARRVKAVYDITYQSNPCLALGARSVMGLPKSKERAEFFEQLDMKLNSLGINRGELGEAISSLLTMMVIDDVLENAASTRIYSNSVEEMQDLTTKEFKSLWSRNSSLLADSNEAENDFLEYKVVTVEAFLERLLGEEDFAAIRPCLSPFALGGLINATHFVSLARLSEALESLEGVEEPVNTNDLVFDQNRNIITYDRLRICMAR